MRRINNIKVKNLRVRDIVVLGISEFPISKIIVEKENNRIVRIILKTPKGDLAFKNGEEKVMINRP